MSGNNKSTKEKRWKSKSKAFRKFVIKNKDVPPQHKELFPEEYINQLYESPLIFFEQLPNIISSINNGEYIIYDHAGINLFTHYIHLYETKSEKEKIYKEKFIDFFQQTQPIITNVYNLHWKTNETFLYDLIKRKKVLFCFDIITPLIEQGIIDDKIMTLQNKDGFTFLYLFYQRNRDYLFKDESSSISQKFKILFTLIYEKDSYTFNQLFPSNIIQNEIIKFIYGINFIHNSLTKVSPEEIIKQLNVIANKAPFLLYSTIYLKNAKINLLNDITITKKDYENGIKALNIIEKQNFISQNNFYFIYDALLNVVKRVRKYDGNTETYLQKLISIILSFQDNIFLKNKFNVYYWKGNKRISKTGIGLHQPNIFHLLFNNNFLQYKDMMKYYSILSQNLFKNKHSILSHFLSDVDMNGAYPINYFLLRLLKFHSNDDILNEDEKIAQKEISDFINNIFLLTRFQSQKFNIRYKPKSKLKEVTIHPISFLHNYATNKYKNIFKFYFDYLLKENLIDIFTRLYPFNKSFWESFVSSYIYYPIDVLMVVTDYLLNNINKYVESSSIKVERVESIFNFCLRSLYDNTSPEEEFRRVYSLIEEKIDVFFKKHSKDKITDKYIIDKYLNLCQSKFEKTDNLINVSRNSDKNDNMFRYFERYQIKYELYLKFLDVISNDDPKNVLLSSYMEEMFVDILSKIPYFYMSRFILVCYNQRKLRNLLFKYIQKIVEKLKIVKTNNEPSADLDEENENGFWFFLYAIKLIHKDLPLYLTHYIIEQIAKNDENKHLFLIPSYIEVNSIYEKYPILFPVDNNLIISDYFCENVITINKPQKKDKCFLTYDSIYRIAAIIPFLFVEEIYERALIPLQKKPFTEQLANLRELSRINEKTKINLINIQTKSKEINSKYCNQEAELKHKCTFIFAVYIYIFNTKPFSRFTKHYQYFFNLIFKSIPQNDLEQRIRFLKETLLILVNQLKIVDIGDCSIAQETSLTQNFILNYKPIFEFITKLPQGSSPQEQKIRKINFFIRKYYTSKDFFNKLIRHKSSVKFLFDQNYNKDNQYFLMNQYIKTNLEINSNNKEEILIYFSINYINNNNQLSFLQSEHKKIISFNPFGFLLKKNKLSNYEKADAFKTFYNSIKSNSEITDENMIDKSQYVNSTLLPQLIATEFSKEKNILLFISNIKQFIVISETLVEDLKENATLFNAFVYLVSTMLLNEKLFPKKNIFPEIMSLLSNELKFIFDHFSCGSVFLIMKKIIKYLYNSRNAFCNLPLLLQDNKYNILNFFFSHQILQHLAQINKLETINVIEEIIEILISFKHTNLFEEFCTSFSKYYKDLFNTTLKTKKKLSLILLAYYSYIDDVYKFKYVLNLILSKQEQNYNNENILTAQINSFLKIHSNSPISLTLNSFTKYLWKHKNSSLFLFSIIVSADKIVKYILHSHISLQCLHLEKGIVENNNQTNIKQTIFESRNINFIMEFIELFNFTKFSSDDYSLISKYYGNKKYYNTYIKSFSTFFPKFSSVKLFLNAILNKKTDLALYLFSLFTNAEKENILKIKHFTNDKKENILHYIVMQNLHEILNDLLHIIRNNFNKYGYLLEEFIIVSKNNSTFKKTPIYYSIINCKYECFPLLYDFCSDKSDIIEMFDVLDSKAPYSKGIFQYINFFKNIKHKMLIKQYNEILFLITEGIFCINEIREINFTTVYYKLFSFLLANPERFNKNDKITPIFSSSNKKLTFQIMYILINVYKVYPGETILNFFFASSSGNNKGFDIQHFIKSNKMNSELFLYMLFLLEKEGYRIIPIEKYVGSDFGSEYVKPEIDRIKQIKGYNLVFGNKNQMYDVSYKCVDYLDNDIIFNIIKCGILEYDLLANILMKEYNIIDMLHKDVVLNYNFNNNAIKQFFMKCFLEFNFMLCYYLDNYEKLFIKKNTIDEIENYVINNCKEDISYFNSFGKVNDIKLMLLNLCPIKGYIQSLLTEENIKNIKKNIHKYYDCKNVKSYGNNSFLIKNCPFFKIRNKLSEFNDFLLLFLSNNSAYFIKELNKSNYIPIYDEILSNININSICLLLYEQYENIYHPFVKIKKLYIKTFYNLLEKHLLSQMEKLTSQNQSISQYDLFFKKIITYNTFINQFIYNLHSFSFESVARNIIIKGTEDKDAKITELMDILQSLSIEIKITSKEEIGKIKEIYCKQYELLFNFIKDKNYANKLSLEIFVLFDENNNKFIECLTEEPIDLYLNTKIEYLLNYIKFQLSHFNNRNNSALFLQNPQSTQLFLISDKSYKLINKNISYLIFLDFILIIQHKYFDYEERISTNDAFHYIMKIIFSLNSNLLNLIISNIPLRNLLKSFIDEFKSFDFQTKPFIDSINQIMFSKQNEISLFINSNNKQIIYETIYKEFIFKLHLFCNQSLHPILNISMKYNNPYYSSFFELNFNFVNILGLISKYLNENILLGVNKHFQGNNELKSEMKKLFAERIKYRIFNQKNTLLFAIITFIEQLNKGLNPWKGNYENFNKIKYSIDFEPELVQGITTEYINVNSLDNFFDIEKINIDLIPKEQNPDNNNINKASPQKELKEVKIMIQLTCCQMKYMRSEKDFVESLKFDGSNSIEHNKYFEKWISHAYLNELLLKLKAKLKSM